MLSNTTDLKSNFFANLNEETLDYYVDCAKKSLHALQNGDDETFTKWLTKIPLAPNVATIRKELCGIEGIQEWIDEGFDFSRVEAEYGKDWLYK